MGSLATRRADQWGGSADRLRQIRFAHLTQPAEMRGDAGEECLMRNVRHPEVRARRLHDAGERPVVNMTDSRKEVVLNLKVQSTNEPGQTSILASKIHSRLDLMHRPGGFHAPG